MRTQRTQAGFVPIPILIALAVAMLLGGFLGFQLGDGTFFSLGVGLGLTLIVSSILIKYFGFIMDLLKPVVNLIKNDKNE